jgi:hypothetical protein
MAIRLDHVQVAAPPRWDDAMPATRRFYVDDPWGNRLEFLEAP